MDHQDSITESDLNRMLYDETREPMRLPFSLLQRITNGFSYNMEIGRGGFATVYKGILEGGAIAVKRLSNTYMHEKEFIREVECLMKIKHQNIVRFLGYCIDTQGIMTMYNGKYVKADIEQRLLCFAYLPNGDLSGYIKDPSCGLEWADRYDIIKGICEGLDHLHQINIVHMDLKPANILLDENMEPQITDFGISRSFDENQTGVDATKVIGTTGYMAPEFVSKRITKKYDLYSLGVIVMEILTGEKMYHGVETITTREKVSNIVETVLKSWSDRLNISHRVEECEQIRVCVEIGIECTELDPANRPVNLKHIIERLPQTKRNEYYHNPLKHRFHPELSDSIPALLHLTNKTDQHVAFRLMEKGSKFSVYNDYGSMYGTVPPRSTCTLIMSENEKEIVARKKRTDLVLKSSISGDKNTMLLESIYNCRKFFEEAKELGHAVYEVALKAFYIPSQEETSSELAVRPTVRPTVTKDIFTPRSDYLRCMDAHPSEPWIVLGVASGNIHIWNHDTKTLMGSFKISERKVDSIKFHAAKKWIVAGTDDKFIHVYDCVSVTAIQKITSSKEPEVCGSYSVGIHPTKSYLLSLSSMKLWNGDKGWEHTRTFGAVRIQQLAFNPEDPNSFAMIVSYRKNVEVWSLDSPNNLPDYTLLGHSRRVNCLDYFKCGDRLYLITGSEDCTAKIWDLHKKACIHTMEVFMSPVVCVISVPGRPYLVTRSEDNTVYLWSSSDFRLKTTINFSNSLYVEGPVCLMGSRRIAMGHGKSITILDIDDGEVIASEGNNEAISVLKIDNEEVVAHEGNNEAISGRVVVGQEKAISIIGTGDEVEAIANEGSNKQSIV